MDISRLIFPAILHTFSLIFAPVIALNLTLFFVTRQRFANLEGDSIAVHLRNSRRQDPLILNRPMLNLSRD
jgi:hypothetical protein